MLREMRNHYVAASYNAELGHEKAYRKYEDLAESIYEDLVEMFQE